jgi:membrane protein implicated in regulation of membrane protease activity
MVVFWLILVVLGLVAEGFTQRFIAVWFAVGALLAALMAQFNIGFGPQLLVFASAAGLLYTSTRSMAQSYLAAKAQSMEDAKTLPGATCEVVEPIDNVQGTGVIAYNGRNWEARAECTVRFEPGAQVRVARLAKGVAYVEEAPLEEAEEDGLDDGELQEGDGFVPDPESGEGAVFEFSGEP